MAEEGSTYSLPEPTGPLRQGEILATIEQHIVVVEGDATKPLRIEIKRHPFVVILTQDCDLAQDFAARSSGSTEAGKSCIPNVLCCEVDLADNLKGSGAIAKGSDIWKRIIQNKDDRFQYFRAIDATQDGDGIGVASLLADFKRVFTLPTEVIYEQLKGTARRRTVLLSPYLEHLSSRYAFFASRVALPRDHHM